MAFCSKCGTQVADGVKVCPKCGNGISEGSDTQQANYNQPNYNQTMNSQGTYKQKSYNQGAPSKTIFDTPDSTELFLPQDIASNKIMAILAYLGLFWLIPFLAAKQSAFARYHVKQGFLVICAQIGYEFIAALLSLILPIAFLLWIIRLAIWSMAIVGIVNAATGRARELPFIGKISSKFNFLN